MGLLSRDGTAEASTSRRPAYTSDRSPVAQESSSDSLDRDAAGAALQEVSLREEHHGYIDHEDPEDDQDQSQTSPTAPSHTPGVIHIPYTNQSISIPRRFHSMTAGAGAGLVSSIVTCPLDVVKTRLQAQHLSTTSVDYEGVNKTVLRIWRQAGFRGFYRGLGPTLGGYLPTWGIYFTVYDLVKDRLGEWVNPNRGSHPGAETALVHVAAAMTAGASGTILTNPLWVVKTRFMAQAADPPSSARYKHTFDAIATIYRTEGFRAFYKGLLPSLMGVSHVAVQFPLYEKAKSWAVHKGDNRPLSPSTILMCSAFSKMVASLATYPHEVLRTRLQIHKNASNTSSPSPSSSGSSRTPLHPTGSSTVPPRIFPSQGHPTLYSPLVTGSDPPPPRPTNALASNPTLHTLTGGRSTRWTSYKTGGIVDNFLKIKRQDGWRGFYRGLSINLVRTVPNSAVTMLSLYPAPGLEPVAPKRS